MTAYPASLLWEEVAFVAYYFHWPRAEVLSLSHAERAEWCRRISGIHRELSGVPENVFTL